MYSNARSSPARHVTHVTLLTPQQVSILQWNLILPITKYLHTYLL